MIGPESIGVVADIPRLFTSLAEWGACVVFIAILRRRWGWVPTVLLGAAGLGALFAVQAWAGSLPLELWIAGMLGAVAVMYAFVLASLRVTATTAAYLTARAFVLAELVASIHWQLDRFYFAQSGPIAQILFMATVYAIVLGLAWTVERRHLARDANLSVGWRDVVVALSIATATFAISNLSFVDANTAFSGRLGPEIFYIRTLVDLSGYIALYVQHELRRTIEARQDAAAMAKLVASQHEQYEVSRRAIDEVNRKYHDMKHHIDAIRAEHDPHMRMSLLDDLEGSIRSYGTQVRTGNSVLDAVLTAKQMYAGERGVQVSVVADGKLLDFVEALDLTAIVGNALDNAFEATARVHPSDQRRVVLSVFARETFVMLRVENTFDGVVKRHDGRIVTRKPDDGHGYGLRNIRAAAEKYGGSLSLSIDPPWFRLSVLLPAASALESS